MERNRRIIAVLLAAVTLVTLVILRGVVGTVFFAITAAYVLLPVADRLKHQGLPAWWAAAVVTAGAYLFGLVLFLPIGAVLYARRAAAVALLRSLPETVTVTIVEFTYVVDTGDVAAVLARELTQLAIALGRSAPVLLAKVVVFGFVLFALVYRGERLGAALLGPLPSAYHDVALAVHERIRETLFVLYFIQAVTAIVTFVLALLVFLLLGIPYPVTLAVLAGVLQFLPVVGPSLLIAAIAAGEVLAGDLVGAAVIAVVGFVVIGFLPDAVLRPRLARDSARLPASLYFVGFTGGLLSLGPIGIVAGPVAVAILLELLGLLAETSTPPS